MKRDSGTVAAWQFGFQVRKKTHKNEYSKETCCTL
jgi:hypothetical protein